MTPSPIVPTEQLPAPAHSPDAEDPFVHIVFDNMPGVALCGKPVPDYELVGPEQGPECPDCAAQADWWMSLEP